MKQATKQEIQAEPSSTKLVIHEIKIDEEAAYKYAKVILTIYPISGKDLFRSLLSLSLIDLNL